MVTGTGMKNETINVILLIMNLFTVCAVSLLRAGKRREETSGISLQGKGVFWNGEAVWLLEFTVYGAGMIRIADLILQGIAIPGDTDKSLFVVRILLAESMLFLFPLWRILYSEQQEGGRGMCTKDGVFTLGMLLLLYLTLQGWQEMSLINALVKQAGYLLLFFGFGYLEGRRKRREYRSVSCQKHGAVPYFAGEEDIMEERYHQRQEEYLKNMEQQYQRTRELWHDLKNHIRVLEILAEEERFGELTDYLGSFRRDVEHRMVPMRTGCAAVDALLGDKLYSAGRQEVELSLQLCDLSRMRIREVDLCVILGNLLDNALEACASLTGHELNGYELYGQGSHSQGLQGREQHSHEPSGQKRIVLRMRQEEDFYYITVINTSGKPLREGDGYDSGKRDRDNGVGHGLGLRSAERVAHRYGGLLVTQYSDGEFRVVVRLQAGGPGSV